MNLAIIHFVHMHKLGEGGQQIQVAQAAFNFDIQEFDFESY